MAFIAAWALLIVVPLLRPRDMALADPSDVYKLCAAGAGGSLGLLHVGRGWRDLNVLVFESEESARAALQLTRNAPRPGVLELDSADLYRVLAHF